MSAEWFQINWLFKTMNFSIWRYYFRLSGCFISVKVYLGNFSLWNILWKKNLLNRIKISLCWPNPFLHQHRTILIPLMSKNTTRQTIRSYRAGGYFAQTFGIPKWTEDFEKYITVVVILKDTTSETGGSVCINNQS